MSETQKLQITEEGITATVEYSFSSYSGEAQWELFFANLLTGQMERIPSGTIKATKPELHAKITALVAQQKEAYDKAQKEAAEKAKADEAQAAADFAAKVKAAAPEGFETMPRSSTYCYLMKEGAQAKIEYNPIVWRNEGRWGSRGKTDIKWIMEYAYKNTRYSTMEKAIAKAVEKINEKVAANNNKKTQEEEEIATAARISTPEVKFARKEHWQHGYGRSGGYTTHRIEATVGDVTILYTSKYTATNEYVPIYQIDGIPAYFATLGNVLAVVKAIRENKVA